MGRNNNGFTAGRFKSYFSLDERAERAGWMGRKQAAEVLGISISKLLTYDGVYPPNTPHRNQMVYDLEQVEKIRKLLEIEAKRGDQ